MQCATTLGCAAPAPTAFSLPLLSEQALPLASMAGASESGAAVLGVDGVVQPDESDVAGSSSGIIDASESDTCPGIHDITPERLMTNVRNACCLSKVVFTRVRMCALTNNN